MSAGTSWDSGLNARAFEPLPAEADEVRHRNGRFRRQGIIAGCLLRVGGRILLSRRAIPPRTGFWTIPGGYVESGESTERGACRELEEEAGVAISGATLMAVYEMPQISQVLFLYTAAAEQCDARAGAESSEVSLCLPDEAPWGELAFASDRRAMYRLRLSPALDRVEFGRFLWGADGRIHLESSAV